MSLKLFKKLFIYSALSGALLANNSVFAKTAEILESADPQLILNLTRGEGRADLILAQEKNPLIKGKVNGINYDLYFTNCTNNENCQTLEFLLQVNAEPKKPFKLETVNRLNRDYNGLTSYLDTKKNLIVARTFHFTGGVTQAHLEHFIRLNRIIIEALQSENLYK